MKIDIALRMKPFSHLPGTRCILPFSSLICRCFPKRLEIDNGSDVTSIDLIYPGILQQFTVTVDLEEGSIKVTGFSTQGYLSYRIVAHTTGFSIHIKKAPPNTALQVRQTPYTYTTDGNTHLFALGENTSPILRPHREKIALGCHKQQDVEMMFRRQDIRELLPFWHFYAQSTQNTFKDASTDLDLSTILQVGFSGIFFPRLSDELHCGISHPFPYKESQPAKALCYSFCDIRKLFFTESDNTFSFLAHLPHQLYCGRYISLQTHNKHLLSFEWTKKKMRRLILWPAVDDKIVFSFPNSIETCRLTYRDHTHIIENNAVVSLQKGTPLYFDRFQK